MRIVCFILLVLMAQWCPAQVVKRDHLEKQRKELISDIKQKKTELQHTQKEKKETLLEKQKINQALIKNQTIVGSLKKEVNTIENSLDRTQNVISCLNADLVSIKNEYNNHWQAIYCDYRFKQEVIPTSNSYNQNILRKYYLNVYKNFRQKEILAIRNTQSDLTDKKQERAEQLDSKSMVLDNESQKQMQLHTDLQKKDNEIKELTNTEKQLAKLIEKRQKAHEELNLAIETIIRDEMNRKLAAARNKRSKNSGGIMSASINKTSKSNTAVITETPESAELSNHFSSNKGKLPWPVEKGFISKKYGVQPHPELKTVMVKNNGIDITTDKGSKVRAVFEGTVVGVQFVPGCNYVVILQHGNFYTVYSNLERTLVKMGDKINTKQSIGAVANNENSEVHFEVWKDKIKMDPSQWVNK
ncbi:MAG: peptidoglycan DD-metalloendopeptidase family protein [Saprospiraceae bacterium]|nr:peptidoglycan DD-metalloendopeptidase family protein [Saprospiraceae bacterium]